MSMHVNSFIHNGDNLTVTVRPCIDSISITVQVQGRLGTDQTTFFPDNPELSLDFATSLREAADKIEALVDQMQPQQKEVINV